MASRTASFGSFVGRQLVAMVLLAAAAVLGMTGAYALHSVAAGSTPAATTSVQFVNGAAQGDSLRRHGTQYAGGAEVSPAAPRQASDQRGGPKD